MRKNTKSALLLSVVSIIICCTMLLGTTMAWFTDSVTSARNQIIAGNLDVELYHTNAKVSDVEVTGEEDLFFVDIYGNDILWEPGVVAYEQFTVKNVGTLALQYRLLMNVYDATETADGRTLEDVIKVALSDTVPETRADVEDLDFTSLSEFEVKSEKWLEPDDDDATTTENSSEDLIVVLYWEPSDSDNDYNMNNENKGTELKIEFGVSLIATQKDHEEDSFGNDYDKIEIPDKDVKVIDGNTYYYYNNGTVSLVTVPYGNVGATFTVPNDVTVLGQGDVYAEGVPVFSKSSPIETITLNEGLLEIKARAITGVKTLTSINFPSTLKAIREQALRQTGMSDITLPASVEYVGPGAFRDMANLTTVTVEGNVSFGNYAFRSCPNLTSIYLLGDDVTFEGTSQFATHYDNGDADGITIYVKNATVAARVYAAQGSAHGYEVKILGEATDGSDATEVAQVKNNAQLSEAIANNATIVLNKGEYTLPSLANNTGVTIIGDGAVVGGENAATGFGSNFGKDTTIKGVTFSGTTNGVRYSYAKGGNTVFEDCTFEGDSTYGFHIDQSNGATFTFNNCTFIGFNAFAGDLASVTFNNCTFLSNGNYGHTNIWSVGYFNNCTWGDNTSYSTAGDNAVIYIDGVEQTN